MAARRAPVRTADRRVDAIRRATQCCAILASGGREVAGLPGTALRVARSPGWPTARIRTTGAAVLAGRGMAVVKPRRAATDGTRGIRSVVVGIARGHRGRLLSTWAGRSGCAVGRGLSGLRARWLRRVEVGAGLLRRGQYALLPRGQGHDGAEQDERDQGQHDQRVHGCRLSPRCLGRARAVLCSAGSDLCHLEPPRPITRGLSTAHGPGPACRGGSPLRDGPGCARSPAQAASAFDELGGAEQDD